MRVVTAMSLRPTTTVAATGPDATGPDATAQDARTRTRLQYVLEVGIRAHESESQSQQTTEVGGWMQNKAKEYMKDKGNKKMCDSLLKSGRNQDAIVKEKQELLQTLREYKKSAQKQLALAGDGMERRSLEKYILRLNENITKAAEQVQKAMMARDDARRSAAKLGPACARKVAKQ